jgi:hypothetical protein
MTQLVISPPSVDALRNSGHFQSQSLEFKSTCQLLRRALVLRLIDEVLSKGNLAVADRLLDANFVLHLPGSPEPMRGAEGLSSPRLAERPRLDGERPGRPRLTGQPEGVFGDVFRLDEKVIAFIAHHFARLRQVDHAIQNYDGHVNAGRPERARHGFREDTLRGLGGREGRRPRHPPQGPLWRR